MIKFKLEIIDKLCLDDIALENVKANIFIEQDEKIFFYVVYINDLFIRFSEWSKNEKIEDFIFDDIIDCDSIFEINRIKDENYRFLGFEGTVFHIQDIDIFCRNFIEAIKEAYFSLGKDGEEYYNELTEVRIEYLD